VFVAGRPRKQAAKPEKTLEQRLWDTADALRGNQEPSSHLPERWWRAGPASGPDLVFRNEGSGTPIQECQ
jgi:hypothetical protein